MDKQSFETNEPTSEACLLNDLVREIWAGKGVYFRHCLQTCISLPKEQKRQRNLWSHGLYRKIGNSKKWKFSFFCQRHALLTSFDIFVVTYRVTNFLPKLINMLLFSTEKKLNFHFWFSPIFRLCRSHAPREDISRNCVPEKTSSAKEIFNRVCHGLS